MRERITVTATRRETELQKTPVAVTAVNEQALQNAEVETIDDLMAVVPSLQVTNGGNPTAFTARIRGVGTQGNNAGLEAAVGTFIDGVYRARASVAMGDLGELSQIEVLRGPQGTLFGRNTSAGILNVFTKPPEFDNYNSAEVTFGSFDQKAGKISSNFVVVEDELAMRLFVIRQEKEGFVDVNPSRLDSYDGNATSYLSGRAQALWQVTNALDIRFIADYTDREDQCCSAATVFPGSPGRGGVSLLPFGTSAPGVINYMTTFAGTGLGKGTTNNVSRQLAYGNRRTDADTQDYGFSAEANWEFDIGRLTSITALRNWSNDYAQDPDFSAADIIYFPDDGSNLTRFENFTHEMRLAGEAELVDWLFGVFYSNEDITRRSTLAVGGVSGPCVPGFNCAGDAFFGQLPTDLERFMSLHRISDVDVPGAPYTALRSLLGGALGGHPGTLPVWLPNTGGDDRYAQNAESIALFTHNIWHISDNLDLTTGLRWTRETKDFSATYRSGGSLGCTTLETRWGLDPIPNIIHNGLGALAGVAGIACLPGSRHALDVLTAVAPHVQSRTEEEFSGIVTLAWEIDEDINTYATYSRGHKAGGFNLDRSYTDAAGSIISTVGGVACAGSPPTQTPNCFAQVPFPLAPLAFTQTVRGPDTSFPAEFVDAYELGLKLALDGGNLFVNTALFHQTFENFQLNTFTGVSFIVTSVPEVISQGVEIESLWMTPVDGLSLAFSVQYTDAHYGDIGSLTTPGSFLALNPGLFLLKDAQITHAPEWVLAGGFDWEFPLFMDLVGLVHMDARWQSEMNTGSNLDPRKVQEDFAVVGAKLAVMTSDETLALEFFARNLFDERYINTAFDSPLQGSAVAPGVPGPTNGSSTIDAFLGEPRTIGGSLKVKF